MDFFVGKMGESKQCVWLFQLCSPLHGDHATSHLPPPLSWQVCSGIEKRFFFFFMAFTAQTYPLSSGDSAPRRMQLALGSPKRLVVSGITLTTGNLLSSSA